MGGGLNRPARVCRTCSATGAATIDPARFFVRGRLSAGRRIVLFGRALPVRPQLVCVSFNLVYST